MPQTPTPDSVARFFRAQLRRTSTITWSHVLAVWHATGGHYVVQAEVSEPGRKKRQAHFAVVPGMFVREIKT